MDQEGFFAICVFYVGFGDTRLEVKHSVAKGEDRSVRWIGESRSIWGFLRIKLEGFEYPIDLRILLDMST